MHQNEEKETENALFLEDLQEENDNLKNALREVKSRSKQYEPTITENAFINELHQYLQQNNCSLSEALNKWQNMSGTVFQVDCLQPDNNDQMEEIETMAINMKQNFQLANLNESDNNKTDIEELQDYLQENNCSLEEALNEWLQNKLENRDAIEEPMAANETEEFKRDISILKEQVECGDKTIKQMKEQVELFLEEGFYSQTNYNLINRSANNSTF